MNFLLSPDLLFQNGGRLALLGWLALALSPAGMPWTPLARRFAGRWVPAVLALAYVALFVQHGMGDGGYDSLAAVQRLFVVPGIAAAGWLHYLAFDLFVGAWISERSQTLGLPHALLLPMLALTFLFGPAGLLAWALVRGATERLRKRRPGTASAAA